ncbi:nucleolar protein dao-5-like [Salvia splendens]|uniref:nucleolar protein dao-5-like n=1 Tax=Salvia splendens TaxID=180675 RepID=UPI001C25CA3F|nr:nucleolar protein dao-5-like [Salvia splendens]
MSAAAAASGSGGMDGDDDKRKKLALPADAPDPFIESSDDADDESAPIEKPASQHRRRKSKPDPKSIGKTRTGKIGKKRITKHPKIQEVLNDIEDIETKISEAHTALVAKRERLDVLIDQMAEEENKEEEVDKKDTDEKKKATDEKEENAEKSKGGASGSQCDHPMAEAVNDEDKKATDEKEENAEKSKGGASGSDQSDQSMPDANLSDDTAHYSKTDVVMTDKSD